MTRLLVSVRDVAEALVALEAGADLIDIKEPRRGSLGAADSVTIAAIVEAVAGRVPLSVALGELLDSSPFPKLSFLRGIQFAKVGLAGCAKLGDWLRHWEAVIGDLPLGTSPVAVVYADPGSACLPTKTVIEHAARLNCAAVLVDTWDKKAGPISDHWSPAQIRSFVLAVRRRDMMAVVAGSLDARLIRKILPAKPDFVAVRGAACRGDRAGELDGDRVRRLKRLVSRASNMGSAVGRLEFRL